MKDCVDITTVELCKHCFGVFVYCEVQSLRECVSNVMRFMLASNHKEPMKPVKREALSSIVKKLQVKQTRLLGAVIAKAQADFTRFGFEMVCIPHGMRPLILVA